MSGIINSLIKHICSYYIEVVSQHTHMHPVISLRFENKNYSLIFDFTFLFFPKINFTKQQFPNNYQ